VLDAGLVGHSASSATYECRLYIGGLRRSGARRCAPGS
jgi:hypothetical protein